MRGWRLSAGLLRTLSAADLPRAMSPRRSLGGMKRLESLPVVASASACAGTVQPSLAGQSSKHRLLRAELTFQSAAYK